MSNTGKQLLNGLGHSAYEGASCYTGNLSSCKKFAEGYSDQSIINGARNAWNNLSYDFTHGHVGAAIGSVAAIGGLIWATKRLSGMSGSISSASEAEPGAWASVNESMSPRAAAYQEQITGRAAGSVYRVNGVKFDGYANGVLQEAKGPGYAQFVRNGEFRPCTVARKIS